MIRIEEPQTIGLDTERLRGVRPPAVSILDIIRETYTDSTSLPLSSNRAPEEYTNGIDFQFVENPFHDSPSRVAGKKPVSELERRRLAEDYMPMTTLMTFMREAYITRSLKQPSAEKQLTATELKGLLQGLMYLPHYLSWRGKDNFTMRGSLPPAVLILSNSAAGAQGALGAYLNEGGSAILPPDPQKMIDATERSGKMVGEKDTSCAASPRQMHAFFSSLITGEVTRRNDSLTHLLNPEEVPRLVTFGKAVTSYQDALVSLRQKDFLMSEKARNVSKKTDPKKLGPVLQFLSTVKTPFNLLNLMQAEANQALGRDLRGAEITYDQLGKVGFELPKELKRLRAYFDIPNV